MTSPRPTERVAHQLDTDHVCVEMTRGTSVTLIGPAKTPILVIPTRQIRLSLTDRDDRLSTMEIMPYEMLVAPPETLRMCCPDMAEVLFIAPNSSLGLTHLQDMTANYVVCRHSDIVQTVQMVRRHLLTETSPNAAYIEGCTKVLTFQAESALRRSGSRNHRKFDPDQWRTLSTLIGERLDGSITVTELAEAVGYSPSQCSRAFKATVGYPPQEYIREQRLLRARELLQLTDGSLANIAIAAGFCSQAHMTATFSRVLGVTPARYRRGTGATQAV